MAPILDDPALGFLLAAEEPALRTIVLTELLERPADDPQVILARQQILEGRWVSGLLNGQGADGGFQVHPYQKWSGAHWRLVSLVELGIPPGQPQAVAAAGQVLDWLTGDSHRRQIQKIDGRTRRCASQEGNALAVCSRLGLVGEARVQLLASSLLEWQWPDGGWNCDKNPAANHSSFYESLAPLWGLVEYYRAMGDSDCLQAAFRAAEVFLRHQLFHNTRSAEIINPEWLKLHYPLYWHYDILQALLIFSRLAQVSSQPLLSDPRLREGLDILQAKRKADGCWHAAGYYWHPPGKRSVTVAASNVEVIDWGRGGPNLMITINALRVLKQAGRI